MLEKVMLSSDQQIPHHDPRMIELWFKVMKSFKPHHVVYAGDWSDNTALGRWVTGGRQELINQLPSLDPKAEDLIDTYIASEQGTRDFFVESRKTAKNANFLCANGNHDRTRIKSYFNKPQFENAIEEKLTCEKVWGFDNLGFDYIEYEDRPKHFAGDFYVHHGVAISEHSGESVRKDTEKFGVSIIRGHSHRLAMTHRDFPLLNKTITGVELGHMMDINGMGAAYDNIHNWRAGFAVGYIEDGATDTSDGKRLHIELVPITRDYTCVVSGKLYSA